MHDVDSTTQPTAQPTSQPTSQATSSPRIVGRWLITFTGFPLGGLAADLLVGPVDGLVPSLVGGLLTGAILGAVQVWGIGRNRPSAVAWIAATAIGLMVGLGIGAAVVGYGTGLGSLALQGAISGLVVGAAQGIVLRHQLGRLAVVWPLELAAIWALGWTVTTSIGVQVGDQFTVFGASGAVVAAILTAVLPIALNRAARSSA